MHISSPRSSKVTVLPTNSLQKTQYMGIALNTHQQATWQFSHPHLTLETNKLPLHRSLNIFKPFHYLFFLSVQIVHLVLFYILWYTSTVLIVTLLCHLVITISNFLSMGQKLPHNIKHKLVYCQKRYIKQETMVGHLGYMFI